MVGNKKNPVLFFSSGQGLRCNSVRRSCEKIKANRGGLLRFGIHGD